MLEELGGTWIKLGQALSMRLDLLPASYCHELLKLLNDVRPFDYDVVRGTIRDELGQEPEQIYAHFERVPFAAASIGQVHRAVLASGEPVAVKVQRPNARQDFQSDIQLMYSISGLLDWFGLFGSTPSRRLIDEFARWVDSELDYRIEARQGELLREYAEGDPLQYIPRIYRRYSTSKVLTMELIEGVPLIDIIHAVSVEDHNYLALLQKRGYDLERIVRHIVWILMNQIHVFGLFHADLHPANIFVLPGGVIAYVDFGIVGKLGDATRESLTRYAWHFFRGDTDRAISELMRWVSPTGRTSHEFTKSELVRIHEEFLASLQSSALPAPATTMFAVAIFDVINRHSLVLSPEVLAYFRALTMADTIRTQMAPDFDLQADVRLFFARLIAQQSREWADPRTLVLAAYEYGHRMSRVLDAVEAQHTTAGVIEATLLNFQSRVQTTRRRLRALVLLVVATCAGLIIALQYPQFRTAGPLPSEGKNWLPALMVAVILVLVVMIFWQRRSLRNSVVPATDSASSYLMRQWEQARTRASNPPVN